jgi:hypothetical protein
VYVSRWVQAAVSGEEAAKNHIKPGFTSISSKRILLAKKLISVRKAITI